MLIKKISTFFLIKKILIPTVVLFEKTTKMVYRFVIYLIINLIILQLIKKSYSNNFFLKEIDNLKSNLATEKLIHDQEFHDFKVKNQQEENVRRKEIQEKMRTLQAAKDDLISENNKIDAKYLELEQKFDCQSLENESLKKNNGFLKNVKNFVLTFYSLD